MQGAIIVESSAKSLRGDPPTSGKPGKGRKPIRSARDAARKNKQDMLSGESDWRYIKPAQQDDHDSQN